MFGAGWMTRTGRRSNDSRCCHDIYSLTVTMDDNKNRRPFIPIPEQDMSHMKEDTIAKDSQHPLRVYNVTTEHSFGHCVVLLICQEVRTTTSSVNVSFRQVSINT